MKQIDFPNASVGCLVNATANKQAKLLTPENVCIKFTTSENLPRLVKPPKQRRREEKVHGYKSYTSDVFKL